MLNEERVKHMTKLALYEARGGSEEQRIAFRMKKDYISFQTFWAALWMTLAYIALVIILVMTLLNDVAETLAFNQIVAVIFAFFGIYLVLLIAYIRRAKQIYREKHAHAYHQLKEFQDELEQLEKMYEREDDHE